jgi:hypothetical protein
MHLSQHRHQVVLKHQQRIKAQLFFLQLRSRFCELRVAVLQVVRFEGHGGTSRVRHWLSHY